MVSCQAENDLGSDKDVTIHSRFQILWYSGILANTEERFPVAGTPLSCEIVTYGKQQGIVIETQG